MAAVQRLGTLPAQVTRRQARPGLSRLRAREARMGAAFVVPTVLGIVVFTAGPIIASFALSLFSWNVINSPRFVGLSNYRSLIHDSVVLHAFGTTAIMAVLVVALQVSIGLVLAIAVERRSRRLRQAYRAAFFFPLMTSAASISIVMSYMFDDHFGVINYYLSLLHLPQVQWLGSTAGGLVTIVLVVVWQQLGFTFILFVAALGNVPKDLLEAASVDGASGLQRFFKVTLSMISPTVLFATIVGLIGAVQIFDQPYIMTSGGPGNATRTVVMTIYEAGFENLKFGYASSISVFLFLAVLLLTALQFRLSRRWVYYAGAEA
jgi:multiple sugar transport system permease protein